MKRLKPSEIRLGPSGEVEVTSPYWSSLQAETNATPLSTNGICDNTSNCSGSTNKTTCQNVSVCDDASNSKTCYVVEIPPLAP